MPIDTRNKRHSVLNVVFQAWRNFPLADGSISGSSDRRHMLGLYAGIGPPMGITSSANTRMSILNYRLPWRQFPVPDGNLGNVADRVHVGWLYRGILPVNLVPGETPTPTTPTVHGGPGQISFTSATSHGGRSIINPPLRGQNGNHWRPSISNEGIVSITDNAQVAFGERFAAFLDATGTVWPWEVDNCGNAEVNTLVSHTSLIHRVSVRCTFSTSSDTSLPFRIYSIRPYFKLQRADVPFVYEANVECRVARPSLRISHTGGPFVIDTIAPRLTVKKNQVKG